MKHVAAAAFAVVVGATIVGEWMTVDGTAKKCALSAMALAAWFVVGREISRM